MAAVSARKVLWLSKIDSDWEARSFSSWEDQPLSGPMRMVFELVVVVLVSREA